MHRQRLRLCLQRAADNKALNDVKTFLEDSHEGSRFRGRVDLKAAKAVWVGKVNGVNNARKGISANVENAR